MSASEIRDSERPAISRGFRLQWEPAQAAHVLLYPEGMVKLNGSAGEILQRCDGTKTLSEIVSELETTFSREGLKQDVAAFLSLAHERGWVVWDKQSDVGDASDGG